MKKNNENKKNNKVLIIISIVVLVLVAFLALRLREKPTKTTVETDSEKFAREYGWVDEFGNKIDNVFVYRTPEEIIKRIQKIYLHYFVNIKVRFTQKVVIDITSESIDLTIHTFTIDTTITS